MIFCTKFESISMYKIKGYKYKTIYTAVAKNTATHVWPWKK